MLREHGTATLFNFNQMVSVPVEAVLAVAIRSSPPERRSFPSRRTLTSTRSANATPVRRPTNSRCTSSTIAIRVPSSTRYDGRLRCSIRLRRLELETATSYSSTDRVPDRSGKRITVIDRTVFNL